MDEYRKNFNVFQQIESVKQILEPIVPDRDSFRLRGLVMRCMEKPRRINLEERRVLFSKVF